MILAEGDTCEGCFAVYTSYVPTGHHTEEAVYMCKILNSGLEESVNENGLHILIRCPLCLKKWPKGMKIVGIEA